MNGVLNRTALENSLKAPIARTASTVMQATAIETFSYPESDSETWASDVLSHDTARGDCNALQLQSREERLVNVCILIRSVKMEKVLCSGPRPNVRRTLFRLSSLWRMIDHLLKF